MGQNANPAILEIKSPNRSIVRISRGEFDNLRYELLFVKDSVRIIKVLYGDKVLWEYTTSPIVFISIFYDYGSIRFILLHHGPGYDAYLVKDTGDVERISFHVYHLVFYELSRSVPVKAYITLDLAWESSNEACAVYRCPKDDPGLVFEPRIGYIATRVVFEGDVIWEATQPEERCIRIIKDEKFPPNLLFHLLVAVAHIRTRRCYLKNNNQWSKLDDETFESLIDRPKANPTYYKVVKERLLNGIQKITSKLKSI